MRKKLAVLILALAALAGFKAGLFDAREAEAACKRICCPGGPCITCCMSPCPTIVCPP